MRSLKKELRDLFPSDMRKFNSYHYRKGKRLVKPLNALITEGMDRGIELLIKTGKFSSRSEFMRFLIIKYFDEMTYYK